MHRTIVVLALSAWSLTASGQSDPWAPTPRIVITDQTPPQLRPPEVFMSALRDGRIIRRAFDMRGSYATRGKWSVDMFVGVPRKEYIWFGYRQQRCLYWYEEGLLADTDLDEFHCRLVFADAVGAMSNQVQQLTPYRVDVKAIGLEIYEPSEKMPPCRWTTTKEHGMASPLQRFSRVACMDMFYGFMGRPK